MLLYFGTGEGKFFVVSLSVKMSLFVKKKKIESCCVVPISKHIPTLILLLNQFIVTYFVFDIVKLNGPSLDFSN